MAASVNDKFSKVSTGARPTTTTVASIRSVSGTSLICDDLTGWDTDAAVHFSTYQLDGQGDVVAGTQTDMKGTVSGNTISNIIITGGTDTGNAVGDIVQQLPTARYAKDLADGLLVSLDQDGTLKAGAVDNSAVFGTGVIPTTAYGDGTLTNAKLSTTTGELGGAWQDWTPTYTGLTVGNGSVDAKYTQVGKTINFLWTITCGTTTTITNGFTVSAPQTAAAHYDNALMVIGQCGARDVATANFFGIVSFNGDLDAFDIKWNDGTANPSTTFPINEATGDQVTISGTYEAA